LGRSRLIDRLSDGVGRTPVTLLSGRTGAGKTVLAAGWLHAQPPGAACSWLTLGTGDDDPAIFWSRLTVALAATGGGLADLAVLGTNGPATEFSVPCLAARLAELPTRVVVCVDNAGVLTDRSIAAGLDVLVRRTEGRLRLVLCADADPPLPLAEYRRTGLLTEIRDEELAFTVAETRALLAGLGAPVTPATAAALTAATGGWVVALRLAAGCLRRGAAPERLAAAVADDDGSPVQYLTARLLGDQPAESRRLLLRTSVTAELWPELVAHLTGDLADGRIAGLAHAGAFAEDAPAAPGGHQIHPLPRELLAAQLRLERPYTFTALHWICAAWFAGAGRLPEAVAHATSADGLPGPGGSAADRPRRVPDLAPLD
jgi:LuxR family maltose regulon positive regulatory protein